MNELRERLGLTILFIAHDLSVVKYFSDKIAVMYYGKMVEFATSDELFDHPLHPYTKSLLSAIPLPDPEFEKGRKRIVYNPIAEHDYSVDKPVMREVAPEHFIYCNEAEFEKYKNEIAEREAEKKKAAEKAAAKTSAKPAEVKVEENTTEPAKSEKPVKKTVKKSSAGGSATKKTTAKKKE